MCGVNRNSLLRARVVRKKTLGLLHYSRKIMFIHSSIPSLSVCLSLSLSFASSLSPLCCVPVSVVKCSFFSRSDRLQIIMWLFMVTQPKVFLSNSTYFVKSFGELARV